MAERRGLAEALAGHHLSEFGDSHLDCVNPPIPGTLNYNSQTTNALPILQIAYASDANGSVPSQIDVRLDWNSGGFGSWTTFTTTGHSAGDVYLLNTQVTSAVAATGYYSYVVEVKSTFGSVSPFPKCFSLRCLNSLGEFPPP